MNGEPKVRLIGNSALLMPHVNQITGSGIYYAPRYQDDRKQWIVVGVGPGKRLPNGTRLLPEVRRGDRCLYDAGLHGNRHALNNGCIIVDADKIEAVWT